MDATRVRALEPSDCAPDDQHRESDEEGRLGERGEMLCLAVPVVVPAVGRTDGVADGEEGQERGDEVGSGVQGLGDEPEAVGDEPDRELQHDQRRRRDDRDQRRSTLRAHGGRLVLPAGSLVLGLTALDALDDLPGDRQGRSGEVELEDVARNERVEAVLEGLLQVRS